MGYFPEADHPPGSTVDIYDYETGKYLGKIPQVPHTYQVIGNQNQFQVIIAETTYGGREELQAPNGILDYGNFFFMVK